MSNYFDHLLIYYCGPCVCGSGKKCWIFWQMLSVITTSSIACFMRLENLRYFLLLLFVETWQKLQQLLHPFNGPFSRTTWVSRHQTGKTFWILLEQEMMGWQWHQLDHMQIICTSLQTESTPVPHHSVFYRPDAIPVAKPTVSKH